jgi:hypothetical protein
MPNGYLKHSKSVNRKKARGGSSKRGCADNKGNICHFSPRNRGVIEDDFSLKPKDFDSTILCPNSKFTTYPVQECTICFERCPVLCLSNKCQWHNAACFKCLRRVYVIDPQKQVPGFITKYPLQCFHPLCNQQVQAPQLEKHNLFHNSTEVRKHHEMLIYVKAQKANMLRTVLCPACDAPKCIRHPTKDKTCGCINCRTKFLVTPDYATIKSLERFGQDKFGQNDGWCRCPYCGILISKGDGCSHMECLYCKNDFDWDEVQMKMPPLCRIPDGHIHHWW